MVEPTPTADQETPPPLEGDEKELVYGKMRALIAEYMVKTESDKLKSQQSDGSFNQSAVRKFIENQNVLYKKLQNELPLSEHQNIGYEMLAQQLEFYPVLCMELKRNVDSALHAQMDWVNYQFSQITENIKNSQTEQEAQDYAKKIDEFEKTGQSDEGIFNTMKNLFKSHQAGEAHNLGQTFISIETVATKKFNQRIKHNLLPDLNKAERPGWIADMQEKSLVQHVATQRKKVDEMIESKQTSQSTMKSHQDNCKNDEQKIVDAQPKLKSQESISGAQKVSRSKLECDCIQDVFNLITVQSKHFEVANSIGDILKRFTIFKRLVRTILPIGQSKLMIARSLMLRIGYALLPEVLDANEENSNGLEFGGETEEEGSWMQKIVRLLDTLNDVESVEKAMSDIELDVRFEVTWELVSLVMLPLMGFSGNPLSYDQDQDCERPFQRELALRLMKRIDPKRAVNNLAFIEESVTTYLNKDLYKLGPDCQTRVSLRDYLQNQNNFHGLNSASIQISDILDRGTDCWIEPLFLPDSSHSRHAVIVISGYQSENGKLDSDWRGMVSFCKLRNIPLFALRWQASNSGSLIQMALEKASDVGLSNEIVQAQNKKDLVSMDNLSKVYQVTKEMVSKTQPHFMAARQRAKESGIMLAYFLAGQNSVFKGQTISLSGYSLGSAVSKGCLNRLAKLERHDIIHNVCLWAGATAIKPQKQVYQKEVFQRVVNGRVINVYSKNDGCIELFEKVVKLKAIGRQPIFDKDIGNASCQQTGSGQGDQEQFYTGKEFRVDNYDLTNLMDGHLAYEHNLDLALEMIRFES